MINDVTLYIKLIICENLHIGSFRPKLPLLNIYEQTVPVIDVIYFHKK